MVILDFGEVECYLFMKCDAWDSSDAECLWSDYEGEYYFITRCYHKGFIVKDEYDMTYKCFNCGKTMSYKDYLWITYG